MFYRLTKIWREAAGPFCRDVEDRLILRAPEVLLPLSAAGHRISLSLLSQSVGMPLGIARVHASEIERLYGGVTTPFYGEARYAQLAECAKDSLALLRDQVDATNAARRQMPAFALLRGKMPIARSDRHLQAVRIAAALSHVYGLRMIAAQRLQHALDQTRLAVKEASIPYAKKDLDLARVAIESFIQSPVRSRYIPIDERRNALQMRLIR